MGACVRVQVGAVDRQGHEQMPQKNSVWKGEGFC